MKEPNTNLTKILKKEHEGKWVALSNDYEEVIDFAASPAELKAKVGNKKVVFMRVLPTNRSFAF